jgi:hypothetical protein
VISSPVPVIELGRPQAFMRHHKLRVLEGLTGFEIGGNAGHAKSVAADLDRHAESSGATLNHPINENQLSEAESRVTFFEAGLALR